MLILPRIVVIEPEWPTRAYLRAELEELGYDVTAHEHPEDAAQYLERWGLRPHLILADLTHNGIRADAVRALIARYPDARVVLVVGAFSTLPTWLRNHASRILRRPCSVQEIVTVIRELAPLPSDLAAER
ncbi:MAG: hypothetical protein RMH81_02090 [Thermomicrobium sp.]|nr:hypothetical protein [Thermomicrobium sp.]